MEVHTYKFHVDVMTQLVEALDLRRHFLRPRLGRPDRSAGRAMATSTGWSKGRDTCGRTLSLRPLGCRNAWSDLRE